MEKLNCFNGMSDKNKCYHIYNISEKCMPVLNLLFISKQPWYYYYDSERFCLLYKQSNHLWATAFSVSWYSFEMHLIIISGLTGFLFLLEPAYSKCLKRGKKNIEELKRIILNQIFSFRSVFKVSTVRVKWNFQ